jgi:hypothetical protein
LASLAPDVGRKLGICLPTEVDHARRYPAHRGTPQLWSANAAAMAANLIPACAKLSLMLTGLAARIVTFLGLSPEEMTAPAFADVVKGLDQRFSKRLQLPLLTGAVLAHDDFLHPPAA